MGRKRELDSTGPPPPPTAAKSKQKPKAKAKEPPLVWKAVKKEDFTTLFPHPTSAALPVVPIPLPETAETIGEAGSLPSGSGVRTFAQLLAFGSFETLNPVASSFIPHADRLCEEAKKHPLFSEYINYMATNSEIEKDWVFGADDSHADAIDFACWLWERRDKGCSAWFVMSHATCFNAGLRRQF